MKPRVLFVEDDDIIREIYTLKFELEGYTVASAANGEIALRLVTEFQPEVILLDMMMPVMDGTEFMRRLRAQPPQGVDPVVLVFSNISAPHQMAAIEELGITDYLVKSDYTPERLTSAVKQFWQNMNVRA